MMAVGSLPVVVVARLAAPDAGAAIRALCAMLAGAGYVEPAYADAVVARELLFPTGLPTDPPVALPHADPDAVRRTAMAVGTLAAPVAFKEMGNPDHELAVRVIFLLAVRGKDEAVHLLKQLVLAFRNHGGLRRLELASSAEEARAVLRELLGALFSAEG